MEYLEAYRLTLLLVGLTGLLLLLQLVIADLIGIAQKHVPGYPVANDHSSLLFRAVRAHANTNESVVIFVLFVAFGIVSAANPTLLNAFSLTYFLARIAHALCYYLGFGIPRSMFFGISLIGLAGMFVVSVMRLLSTSGLG